MIFMHACIDALLNYSVFCHARFDVTTVERRRTYVGRSRFHEGGVRHFLNDQRAPWRGLTEILPGISGQIVWTYVESVH